MPYSLTDTAYGSAEGLLKAAMFDQIASGETPITRQGTWRYDASDFHEEDIAHLIERKATVDRALPSYILRSGGTVAYLNIVGTAQHVTPELNLVVAGTEVEEVDIFFDHIRDLIPKRVVRWDASKVPITFWSLSQQGPKQTSRDLDVPAWDDIRGNYAFDARAKFDELMSPDFEPGAGGQLILWHGPPGTGKTYALRSLAREWFTWADMHYITDPETFFSQSASYMLDVLLSSNGTGPSTEGREPDPRQEGGRWKVLILEDAGEMMSADARERAGQGLSRLLNVVDGMIGQGIRVLVVCTTNEEVRRMHEAVQRPGRCASIIKVPKLTAEEVAQWRDENDIADEIASEHSLAELYELKTETPKVDRDQQQAGFGFALT